MVLLYTLKIALKSVAVAIAEDAVGVSGWSVEIVAVLLVVEGLEVCFGVFFAVH